jgi:uncharacterized protein YdeI (YjbR/CyaY-like superfamily)
MAPERRNKLANNTLPTNAPRAMVPKELHAALNHNPNLSSYYDVNNTPFEAVHSTRVLSPTRVISLLFKLTRRAQDVIKSTDELNCMQL